MTIIAMAYLTYLGATAGSPTEIDLKVAPQYEAGKQVVAQSGCLACHKIGDNGGTLAPDLTEIGAKLPAQGIARTLVNPAGIMPQYGDLPPEKFNAAVKFLASLQ
jgi:cytochrome c5